MVGQMLAAAIYAASKELENELAQARHFAKSGPDRRFGRVRHTNSRAPLGHARPQRSRG